MAKISVYWAGLALATAVLRAQIPAQEDLETKSKRESWQEGLEMREIRESAAKDAGEALARIDGISKLRKGAIANDVVLRGFQSNNLNLLIDGVRIYGACPGHMDPAAFHVDFAEIERIEVTKGGFDLQNQGSLGGNVNIIRKRSAPGFHLTPALQLGSFGYVNPSLTGSAGTDRIEVSGGYSFRQSNPFRDGRGLRMTEVGGYLPAHKDDDAFRINTSWGALRFSPARNQSGELSYTHQNGANVLYPYLQMDSPYDIADRLSARYEWRERSGAVERIQVLGYYTAVRHWMTDELRTSSLTGRDVFSMATYAHTRVSGGRADFTLRRGVTAGFESYQRNWDAVNSFRMPAMVADQNIVPNVNTTTAGFFADWNYNITDRIRVGAGARFDTANMAVRSTTINTNLLLAYKGVANLDKRDSNPSLNARFAAGLTNSLEFFVGGGSTVRVPDAQERYFNHRRMGSDWVGNPALVATRNTEATTGLNFRRRGFYLKPSLFYSSLANYITVHNQARRSSQPGVMNTMARSYENTDARIYGGEVTYGLSLLSRWLISGGASYSRGTRDAIPSLGIYNTNFAEMPPLRGRTSVRYGTRLWFAEVEGIAAAPQRRVDTDLREAPTAGYGVLNLKAGWHAKRFTLTAGLDNIFNHYYIEHLSFQRDPFRTGMRVPEPGRNLFLNIAYAF
jgi:iron complex outermembrane receptor protein